MDHNEKSQAVNGIEEAEVQEIIDHHRLGGLETIGPVYFRNQPVGCTAYDHLPDVSGKRCRGRATDGGTSVVLQLFRIRYCSVHQPVRWLIRRQQRHWRGIAGIDMEEHAKEMFNGKQSAWQIRRRDLFPGL